MAAPMGFRMASLANISIVNKSVSYCTWNVYRHLLKKQAARLCIRRSCSDQNGYKTTPGTVRVRFAPSPTGYLHLGGLRTALYNYLFARANQGSFILRIEDTDQSRAVQGAMEKLEKTLQWAQIEIDEGPSVGGQCGPYIQSERLPIYQEHIQRLMASGAAYPCFCSARRLDLMKKEANRRGEPSRYDGKCRGLTEEQVKQKIEQGLPYTVRLKLKRTDDPWDDLVKGACSHDIYDIEGDPILMKSDGYPTYHFANVVDDHLMGITHVLRGSEWLSSTPKHILLYEAFGWVPPRFGHLPLIVNADGTKLSKRQGDVNVDHYQELGYFPQALLNYVTTIGGGFQQDTLGMTLQDMEKAFDARLIRNSPGRLNPTWLKEANRILLKQQASSEDKSQQDNLASQVRNFVVKQFGHRFEQGQLQEQVLSDSYILRIVRWSLIDDRTSVTSDFVKPELDYLWVPPNQSALKQMAEEDHMILGQLEALIHWLQELESELWERKEDISKAMTDFVKSERLQMRKFFKLARLALTGSVQGAPLAETMVVIGQENVLERLREAVVTLRSVKPENS